MPDRVGPDNLRDRATSRPVDSIAQTFLSPSDTCAAPRRAARFADDETRPPTESWPEEKVFRPARPVPSNVLPTHRAPRDTLLRYKGRCPRYTRPDKRPDARLCKARPL